ncbi:MAG: toll/interleukin-1 receptor domain-containing protein [Ignavibacteriaceae bacterium]|jgi:hypothetical protein
MEEFLKPRVFISHSSKDKSFTEELAWNLSEFGFDVWFDKWEIAIGDSIVDKVFEGIKASDSLIIVLSEVSVNSRWVKEELNTALMRRISENDIKILPVMIETCDVPVPLNHIRYADFRENKEEGLALLLESLAPGHRMWQSLSHLYDHFCLLSDQLLTGELDDNAIDKILKIHSLLESALDLRTEIEFRRTRQKMKDLNFFEKIGLLVESGVDVRSQTWNALVYFRASLAHNMRNHSAPLQMFTHMLKERYKTENIHESLERGINRLREIMHMICFEQWDYTKNIRNKGESIA